MKPLFVLLPCLTSPFLEGGQDRNRLAQGHKDPSQEKQGVWAGDGSDGHHDGAAVSIDANLWELQS